MTERKINSLFLSNAQKTKLRDYYSTQTGRKFRSITDITKEINTINKNSELTYELLRFRYNDAIDSQRLAIKAVQAKKRRAVKKQLNMAIPFSELPTAVNFWRVANGNPDKFQITLKGVNGYEHTFTFFHQNHFENWFKHVTENDEVTTSDNVTTVLRNPTIFEMVKVVSMQILSGGCNDHATTQQILKTNYYEFNLTNPYSKHNDCFLECYKLLTGLSFKNIAIRRIVGLAHNIPFSIDDAKKVMDHFSNHIQIIDETVDDVLEDGKYIILIGGKHYKVVNSLKMLDDKNDKTKRGTMFFDFETRDTTEFWQTKIAESENRTEKLYVIKDTICCVDYVPFKGDAQQRVFTSNSQISSARQFINFLLTETKAGRSYNIYAHNGSKFDFYFVLAELSKIEMMTADLNMRGTSVIRIRFRQHIFKDTCCFLTDSLSKLSESFKAQHGKITEVTVRGKTMTSAELCFYKPQLKHSEFMKLEIEDPEFWSQYVNYCMYDCIALREIWTKFSKSVEDLLNEIFPRMKGFAPLGSAMTIGAHAKKIVDVINSNNGRPRSYKVAIEKFAGIHLVQKDGKWQTECDMEKYKFLCNFKRGGISHCNKPGKHINGITGVDIASQYPAAMMNSMLPCGQSQWTTEYDSNAHGFYRLTNVKFAVTGFKPTALSKIGQSLKWNSDTMDTLDVDSYILKYLIQHYGITFDVVRGLISYQEIESSKLFGKFITAFYEQKKQQDKYNDTNDLRYNEALRSTCKLYLNSLSGKLVENPANHYSMKFVEESTKNLNGVGIEKTFNDDKFNSWIVAGLMVYSYSKRLLFEYIHCLPNKHDSVIHVETDGIYFDTRDLNQFNKNLANYSGQMDCVKFGSELGNLKIEKTTHFGDVAYFLGKKMYCITMPKKDIYRCKGLPVKSIDLNGNSKILVDRTFYEGLYNGIPQTRTWAALKKELFVTKTRISSFEMTRKIQPMETTYIEHN